MQILEEALSAGVHGSGRDAFRVSDAVWRDWRWQLEHRLQGESGLERIPGLGPTERAGIHRVIQQYAWSVTPYLFSLVRWDDPEDPIRKQFLPNAAECSDAEIGCPDPLEEQAHTVVPGLIQRYPDRAVLLSTNACAAYCRHCFRKRLWGKPCARQDADGWNRILSHLRSDPSIRDVLISGGDPLTLEDEALEELLDGIRRIPHVQIIRIGTRIPVVLPQRITSGL
ncbi:MAG: KamA family radical SAM protein, partial [Thermodesulfobacteriota bacterium]